MRSVVATGWVLLLAGTLAAQTSQPGKPAAKKHATPPAVTAEDVQALRQALEAQQQQIRELQQELQQRDRAWQQLQQQLQQAQSVASQGQAQAAAAETAATEQKDSFSRLQSDVADVKGNMTAAAVNTQEEQKRVSALEGILGRFRLSGDIRLRQEDFFQSYSGCAGCNARVRERIRLRLGIEGKLNEDFTGGLFLASGVITDPTSTNETLTSAFERKNISFDRGYITYNPRAHKWLNLTGGKFAYTWVRTNQTFDPDLNPEGFSEKFSFDLKAKTFRNVTFTALQLLFNETNRPASGAANCVAGFQFCVNGNNTAGADSFAAGGQFSAKLQLGKRITVTPAYTVLNWRNADTLLNQSSSVTGSTDPRFAPNGITNATVTVGTTSGGVVIRSFLSRFLYSDLIVDTSVNTGMPRWPWRVVLEYLDNLNAADHPLSSTGSALASLGRQSHLYRLETSLGQLKQQGDWLFGYSFHRQEQDSVLAAFNESDQRAPTNIIQHTLYAQYNLRNNVTLAYTLWVGRTLNSNLVNAALAPGISAGQSEPYLKRMQFDAIYKF